MRDGKTDDRGSMMLETVIILPLCLIVLLTMCRMFIFSVEVYRMERELLDKAIKGSVYAGAAKDALDSAGLIPEGVTKLCDGLFGEDCIAVTDSRHFGLLPSLGGTGTGAQRTGAGTGTQLTGTGAQKPETGWGTLTVSRTLRFRLFTGHHVDCLFEETEEGDTSEAGQVYVTESGTVYHLSPSCSSLKVSIRPVAWSRLDRERNSGGAKYYACEKCAVGKTASTVYVTPDGNRYHCSSACPSLKRSVKKVSLSEAEGLRPCKRCASK